MARWLHTLDIKHDWKLAEAEQIKAPELARRIVPKMRELDERMPHHGALDLANELQEIADDSTSDFDDFDEVWERVYDWADAARVWVKIF